MIFPKSFFKKSISLCLLTVLSFVLFQTCTDDKSPTEPEAPPSIATATIGSGGGILKTDEFELSVPAGAFPIDTKLTLNLVEDENSRLDNIVSKEYMIEGLPQSFSQPLTIKLKYSGKLTDSSYIAVGENGWVSSLNQEITSYYFLSAADSLGYLSANIAPTGNGNSVIGKSNLTETNNKKYFHIRSANIPILTRGQNFIIYAKSYFNEAQVHNIGNYLETAYTKFEELGFDYKRRTVLPIEVYLEEGLGSGSDGKVYGYYTIALYRAYNLINSYNAGYLRLNADFISDTEEMKTTIGHEFFHLVQGLYDTRGIWAKKDDPPPNYWINEATSTWAEGLFSSDPKYVSGIFSTSSNMVLYGANDSGGDVADFYGYGMSPFMKYISEKFGNGVFVKIYDEIYKGNKSFSAIDNVIPNPTSSFWDEFIQQYLTYSIYKLEPQWLTKEAASAGRSFTIRQDTDTVKTYSENFNNLSARLYSVRAVATSLTSIDENSQLVFETEGNIIGSIQLFKENKEESVYLKQGQNSVTLDNFRSITDSGYVIVAAVTNSRLVAPYKETSSGKLTIKVINKDVKPIPVITEIYDSSYDRVFGEKRFYSIPGNYFIIKGQNLKDVQKVYANGVEFEPLYAYSNVDSLFIVKMLPDFKGHINIKVLTDAGESNEFTYLSGVPIDYISSSDSLRVEFYFTVKYYNSDQVQKTRELRLKLGYLKNELNWNNNQVTINLNKINEYTGKNGTGTAIFTFSDLENCELDNIVVDYTETDGYTIHYEEENHYFGSENIYLIRDNPSLTKNLLTNDADMRYTTQPSISGILHYYGDAEFSEIDLTVDSYYRRFAIRLFHFR